MSETSWPPDPATRPRTPMLDQIAQQTPTVKLLYRFLDWVASRTEIALCHRHQHSEACRGAGGAIECGIELGALEPNTATDNLGVPEQFLGINHAEADRESAGLAAWMDKGRPGGRAA